MRDLLTTQNQNCYKELIEKEAYTRLAWKTKYGPQYSHEHAGRRKKVGEVSKVPAGRTILPPVMKPPEKSQVEATPPQMTQAVLDSPITLMRSVTPVTKDLIYQGISREGKGRQLYLQRRTVKNPEDKYELPLLSSWDYGWRLGDFVREVKTPINGRSAIVKNTFYARNGIFNFPASTDKLG